jgi:hypothetical protein
MKEKLTIKQLRKILKEGIEFINVNGSNVKFDEEGFMVFSNFVLLSIKRIK